MNTIDQYIETFPPETQTILRKIRDIIKEEAPQAKEAIKYRMPTFVQGKNLIHFAAYKNHIGIYPTPSGIEEFKKEFSKYKTSKGAIQFQLNEPIPYELIRRIVRFRVKQLS